MGLPLDYNGNLLIELLKKHNCNQTEGAEKLDHVDAFGFKNKYVKLIFDYQKNKNEIELFVS